MLQKSCITAMPWGLSCRSAGMIKIAVCAKYGETKIELVEVDKTKRHGGSYGPANGRDLESGPLKSWQSHSLLEQSYFEFISYSIRVWLGEIDLKQSENSKIRIKVKDT